MSLLTRKLVKLLAASSSSSNTQRLRLLPHPALILHQSSSLYSTSSSRNYIQKKPKPQPPSPPSPTPTPTPSPSTKPKLQSHPAWTTSSSSSAAASHPKKDEEVVADDVGGGDHDWPKPSEIPFQAKVGNAVNLIGYVQMPVQFKASPDGKFWAGTIISQEATSLSPLLWIPIIFEGDLAHIATCHLKENDYVYITGQLRADPPPFAVNQGQANVQVQVHSISFVQQSTVMEKKSIPHNKKDQAVSYSVGVKHDGNPALVTWRDLLENPKEWKDYRKNKRSGLLNPKHPDFKRKDGNVPLWLNTAPAWVLAQLEGLEFDCQIQETKQVKENKEDKWKDLVANPSKWWDNRSDKIKEKYPDFKHKDTGEALWLSDSPAWVLSELPPVTPKQNASISKRQTLLS